MKLIHFALIGAVIVIGGTLLFVRGAPQGAAGTPGSNVYMENGKQVIEITAQAGYWPKKTNARAGVPTVVRMRSSGSFDCSSYVVIPDAKYRGNLPQSGSIDIPVPTGEKGSVMRGFCGMGMYSFSIQFD